MPKPIGGGKAAALKQAPVVDDVVEDEIKQASKALAEDKAPQSLHTAKLVGEATVGTEDKAGLKSAKTVPVEHPSQVQSSAQTAFVKVGCGRTIAMPNYENQKPYVEITMPCAPNSDSLQETYEFCLGFVDERLDQIEHAIREGLTS